MLGQLLDGRYKVIQVLGAGGFGQTFVAEDTRTFDSKCVVKQLKPASSDPNFLETARRMFQVEAKTLELLGKKHAQIPQLLAYFEQDQEFYLVQEYIEGQTLSTELCPGKKWTEDQVIGLLREILNILAFVHQSGVIHRDVKPDNIIRRQADNKFVLVDFGAVKQIRTQTTTGQGLMSATIAIGTPGYMPSEQGIGKPKPSSDIYALGVIAIQALTGLNPSPDLEDTKTGFQYDQNTGEIIWHDKVQASPGLAAVLTKMVKPHFPDRYASASEALQALEQLKFGYTPTVSANPQGYTPTVAHSPANSNTVLSNSNNLHGQTVTANQAALPTVAQSSRDSGSKGLVILGGGLASLAVAIGVVLTLSKPSVSPTGQSSPVNSGSAVNTGNAGGTNNSGSAVNTGNAGGTNNSGSAVNTGNAGNPPDEGPSILSNAQTVAETGDYQGAIDIASSISANSTIYGDAQNRILKWQDLLKSTAISCVSVDSKQGWQHFDLPGAFTRVASIGGGWSVDAQNYSFVGSEGHSGADADALTPYNQYKFDQNFPFGALLMGSGGGVLWIQNAESLNSNPFEAVDMRINDEAFGDNDGSLEVCFGN